MDRHESGYRNTLPSVVPTCVAGSGRTGDEPGGEREQSPTLPFAVFQRGFIRILTVLLLCVCTACREQIVHDLSETDANRVMSKLHTSGIDAEKVTQADGRWAVAVDEGEIVRALMVLDTTRVLARRQSGESVKSGASFIPSREEQWFRYESSIAAALEATLITLPGVLEARVHLNLPQLDPILGVRAGASASGSVLLVTEPTCTTKEEDVAAIVSGGAGIPLDRVRVLKSNGSRDERVAEEVSRQGVNAPNAGQEVLIQNTQVPLHSRTPLPLLMLMVIGAVLLTTSIGVYLYRMRRKSPFELRQLADELQG